MTADITAQTEGTVLVTGANGYVGTHVVAQLLESGYRVRAAVRNVSRKSELESDLMNAGHRLDDRIEVVETQLESDEGWDEAVAGVRYVIHVASPFPAGPVEDEDDIIVPARDGVLRVLRAARDGGVERVVLTSSYAAIGYSPKAGGDVVYTEEDWTNPSDDLQPYIKSKVIAERAAWDFMASEGGSMELTVINPVGIFGPALGPKLSTSVGFVKTMLDGSLQSIPRQHFGVVDVRDVARLHVLAMTRPEAAGERFLAVADGPSVSFLQVAEMLRATLGELASRVSTTETNESSDGADPDAAPVISNAKAKNVLGWELRPVLDTIRDTGLSLERLELIGRS